MVLSFPRSLNSYILKVVSAVFSMLPIFKVFVQSLFTALKKNVSQKASAVTTSLSKIKLLERIFFFSADFSDFCPKNDLN